MGTIYIATATALYVRSNVGKLGSHVLFSSAELWCVNCDEEALAATLLSVLYDSLCNLAILVYLPPTISEQPTGHNSQDSHKVAAIAPGPFLRP